LGLQHTLARIACSGDSEQSRPSIFNQTRDFVLPLLCLYYTRFFVDVVLKLMILLFMLLEFKEQSSCSTLLSFLSSSVIMTISTFFQASATAVGHWPWFTVYNYMNKHMPWDDGAFRLHFLTEDALQMT
jgi:hypothetical protein